LLLFFNFIQLQSAKHACGSRRILAGCLFFLYEANADPAIFATVYHITSPVVVGLIARNITKVIIAILVFCGDPLAFNVMRLLNGWTLRELKSISEQIGLEATSLQRKSRRNWCMVGRWLLMSRQ